MKQACVIGWPIGHSRSPIIHDHWLKTYGIAGSYSKVAVRPEDAASFLTGLAGQGFDGCNVTVPHKEIAFRLARERDPTAAATGAANTLWLEGCKLYAANTDTYGYMTHLGQSAPGWDTRDAPVSVLGAGGAARAIIYGFLQAGVGQVRLFNRSRERADDVAAAFGSSGGASASSKIVVFDWAERGRQSQDASVIVNTTSLGLNCRGDIGIDFAAFHAATVVSDIVYTPLDTAFLSAARRYGLRTVDGLGMLLHQAVPGFERWFGVRPEVTPELRALVVSDINGLRP